jgi:hypothetical protein
MVTSLSCDCPSRQYYSVLRVILILLCNLGPNRNSNTNSNVQPRQGVPPAISGLLPLLSSLAARGGFRRPALATLLSYESLSSTVLTPALVAPLVDTCALSRSRRKRNDASPPRALQRVSPTIFGSLTLPSSLAACGGVQRLNPFPRGWGSGPAGLAAVGRAPDVQDLVELRFHNFLPLFCQCGTHHRSCISAVSLPKGRLDLEDCRSHYVFT